MATINFKGKNSVWNHHLSVPYQVLEKDKKLSVSGKNEDENLIIEADNLIALKSLLPKYQGRIKCIYIDPPYNTGNENWVFNDKSNSPLIKDWIGRVVGKDDLTRHDKWLCMMTPRIKLLQELLSEDGVIFISIDDNEVHHLKMLMDEIFEEIKCIGILVRKTAKGGGNAKGIVSGHDYILVYKKKVESLTLLKDKSIQKEIITRDGKEYILNDDFIRKVFGKYNKEDEKVERRCLYEELEKYKGVSFKKEVNEKIKIGEYVLKPYKDTKKHMVCRLEPLDESSSTIYSIIDGFLTEFGKNDLVALDFKEDFFEYPKPVGLIRLLVNSVTKFDKKAVILDSFAGSGTTAQAVSDLNKEDKGDRKFILVQLPEKIEKDKPAYKTGFRYVHEITRERVRRVIKRDKLDIGFSYMKLGAPIDAESILTGDLPTYREFAKYVYYLATGKTMDNEKSINEKNYFVGKINGETVYLIYEKDKEKLKNMAITLEWAEKINKKDSGRKIVYAPACFLDEEYLEKFNIDFVSIPYNLFEKK